jgi:hypothetical protein
MSGHITAEQIRDIQSAVRHGLTAFFMFACQVTLLPLSRK